MKRFSLVLVAISSVLTSVLGASADTLMLDFGPDAMTADPVDPNFPQFPQHLVNSPLHQVGGLSLSETTWNTVGDSEPTMEPAGALLFSDGSTATGVSLNFGSHDARVAGTIGDPLGGTGAIDLTVNPDRSLNFSGGNTGPEDGLFAAGAVGRDGIFANTNPSAIGVQVTGLAAGTYEVYVMGRNRNTGNSHDMNAYAGAGTAGANFDFDGYDSMAVSWAAGSVTNWVAGHEFGATVNANENYSLLTVTLEAGEALNVGVDAGPDTTEDRAFLSMIQITELTGPIPVLRVNRTTGEMTLENDAAAGSPLLIRGYSITSESGALDQATWNTITDHYDDAAGPGDGSVDSNDQWTILSTPGEFTDLSEFQFGGSPGDAGSIAPGETVDLNTGANGPWLPSPDETDLEFDIILADGSIIPTQIIYEGNGGESLIRSDLNHDGSIDLADYLEFDANHQTDLSSMSPAQAYLAGDIDGDLDSDINDFLLFQSDYDDANGGGSFATMLQSVPEPSSLALLGLGVLAAFGRRHRRIDSQRNAVAAKSFAKMLLLITTVLGFASTASATALMLDFGPDAMTADPVNPSFPQFPQHLVNSPLHQVGGLSLSETTWNTVGDSEPTMEPAGALLYSDGSTATGVAINFGSHDARVSGTIGDPLGGTGAIDLGANPDRSLNFSGGNTGPDAGLFAAGAVGRDGIFANTQPSAIGVQVTGLAEGTYEVYVMGRNRNTGNTHDMNAYAGAGTAGVNYDFDGYDSMAVSWTAGSVTNWVAGHEFEGTVNANENYSILSVTLAAGEALNIGVDAGPDDTESRAFLSMIQVRGFVPPLQASIHPVTGEVVLENRLATFAESVSLNSYQITSDLGSLLPTNGNWNSLDDQDVGFGAGVGESWNESNGSSSTVLSETFLLGDTSLDPGDSISIGNAYNLGIGDTNMSFSYLDTNSNLVKTGTVDFMLLGDMDGNGELDLADVNPFVEALTARASYETNNPGVDADLIGDFNGNGKLDLGDVAGFKSAVAALATSQSSSSVPEPSAGVLLLIGLAGLIGQARRAV